MKDLETAEAFDFWSALWLMSIALGRDVIIDRPRLPVHLNIYCIFIGESGWPRKSTAVKHAMRVARQYIYKHAPDTVIVTDSTTPQQFVNELVGQSKNVGHATACIAISELVRFLGRDNNASQMPGLLTDLYDCPEIQESPGTIARGRTTIRKAYISFLGASTPAWLHRSIDIDVIEGGFTSRILFVRAETGKSRIPWPRDSSPFNVERLTEQLHNVKLRASAQHNGRIAISDEGLGLFSRWYNDRDFSNDEFSSSFESREDEHILRIGALLCVNRRGEYISEPDMVSAISIIEELKRSASEIFDSNISHSRTIIGCQTLCAVLRGAGVVGIKHSELTQRIKHRLSSADLKAFLEVFHQLRYVKKLIGKPKGGGRPHTRWVATDLLESIDVDNVAKLIPLYHSGSERSKRGDEDNE